MRESEQADLAEKHDFSVHAEISVVGDLNSVASSNFDVCLLELHPDSLSEAVGQLLWTFFFVASCKNKRRIAAVSDFCSLPTSRRLCVNACSGCSTFQ